MSKEKEHKNCKEWNQSVGYNHVFEMKGGWKLNCGLWGAQNYPPYLKFCPFCGKKLNIEKKINEKMNFPQKTYEKC